MRKQSDKFKNIFTRQLPLSLQKVNVRVRGGGGGEAVLTLKRYNQIQYMNFDWFIVPRREATRRL